MDWFLYDRDLRREKFKKLTVIKRNYKFWESTENLREGRQSMKTFLFGKQGDISLIL